jgi:hypothetical protein
VRQDGNSFSHFATKGTSFKLIQDSPTFLPSVLDTLPKKENLTLCCHLWSQTTEVRHQKKQTQMVVVISTGLAMLILEAG